ncbi:MMPL family transporter [Pilimelia columellifera]
MSGKLAEVATNDNASFLPADAEATRAQRLAGGFVDQPSTPAVIIYERPGGLTPADLARVNADIARIIEVEGVLSPLPPPARSPDGQAVRAIVPVADTAEGNTPEVVAELRAIATSAQGLEAHVAGPAGLLADLVTVFESIDGTLLLVTASVVVFILLLVYRSPVLWIVPMICNAVAFSVSAAAVYYLAKADIIVLNGQAQGILTVLVFGAGTDYALLLVARYREELTRHQQPVDAMRVALRGAFPAILASGGTVIAGLLCLLLSALNSNRALGPVSAVGIAATLLVMLTLLPALLVLGGRRVFWPRTPQPGGNLGANRLWRRVAVFVARRARVIWVATTLALLALAGGLVALDTRGLSSDEIFTTRTESVIGQEALARHFPAGTGSPAQVFTKVEALAQTTAAVRATEGVSDVRVVPDAGGPAPKVVDGWAQVQATLTAALDSDAAEQTVERLRTATHAVPGADALVGGFTAVSLDTRTAAERDQRVIIPVILLVIAVILALLLRSLMAPALLIATVVLSFAATLGICALLFEYVFGFAGSDPSFPLFAFVFLVALGIDYNIFLMSRVREEALVHGARAGLRRGLAVTGGVITSAGVVLAATFVALAVLPLVVLVELGVAVALGVLLDAVIVRSLLVPALAYDLGAKIWWPSRAIGDGRRG